LHGVIVHFGSTRSSGHYYSFVKGSNGIWYEIDDDEVKQISINTLLKQNIYILFYSRMIDLKNGEFYENIKFMKDNLNKNDENKENNIINNKNNNKEIDIFEEKNFYNKEKFNKEENDINNSVNNNGINNNNNVINKNNNIKSNKESEEKDKNKDEEPRIVQKIKKKNITIQKLEINNNIIKDNKILEISSPTFNNEILTPQKFKILKEKIGKLLYSIKYIKFIKIGTPISSPLYSTPTSPFVNIVSNKIHNTRNKKKKNNNSPSKRYKKINLTPVNNNHSILEYVNNENNEIKNKNIDNNKNNDNNIENNKLLNKNKNEITFNNYFNEISSNTNNTNNNNNNKIENKNDEKKKNENSNKKLIENSKEIYNQKVDTWETNDKKRKINLELTNNDEEKNDDDLWDDYLKTGKTKKKKQKLDIDEWKNEGKEFQKLQNKKNI
jgi:hypothetical protein